jgi:hypothetical protein
MWSDLSNRELLAAARARLRRSEPLPLDLTAELDARGLVIPTAN